MIKALKKGLIGCGLIVVFGGVSWVCEDVSAQASHLFRTYKHEVPQKLPETTEAVAEGKKFTKKVLVLSWNRGKG